MPRAVLTRITLLLPAPTTLPQHYLVGDVITDLIQICGGATISSQLPPVFDGWWDDRSGQPPQHDSILLILADAPLALDDPDLWRYLDGLKLACQVDFGQNLIWVTVHRVDRIATYD